MTPYGVHRRLYRMYVNIKVRLETYGYLWSVLVKPYRGRCMERSKGFRYLDTYMGVISIKRVCQILDILSINME